jgi:uncharacterized protein YbaP (TraB family)
MRYLILIILLNINLFSKSLLWEIKSEKNTVYLLGSVHLADSSLYPLNKEILEAFDNSKVFVMEMDISRIDPSEVMKYTMLPDTFTLAGFVDENSYNKFAKLFEKHNIPNFIYNKMKPWFAVMTLQSLEMIQGRYSAEYGIDLYFLDKATTRNMPIKELESLEIQMNVLDTLNKFSGKYLEYTLEEINNTNDNVAKILKAWKQGDTLELSKIINAGSYKEDFEKVMYIINDKRNFNMVKRIEDFLNDTEPHFVVVGLAHLLGENGLINLLKNKKKYKINQK